MARTRQLIAALAIAALAAGCSQVPPSPDRETTSAPGTSEGVSADTLVERYQELIDQAGLDRVAGVQIRGDQVRAVEPSEDGPATVWTISGDGQPSSQQTDNRYAGDLAPDAFDVAALNEQLIDLVPTEDCEDPPAITALAAPSGLQLVAAGCSTGEGLADLQVRHATLDGADLTLPAGAIEAGAAALDQLYTFVGSGAELVTAQVQVKQAGQSSATVTLLDPSIEITRVPGTQAFPFTVEGAESAPQLPYQPDELPAASIEEGYQHLQEATGLSGPTGQATAVTGDYDPVWAWTLEGLQGQLFTDAGGRVYDTRP